MRRKYTTHANLFCKHCQVDDPSRLGGQKEPVYPVILLATHTGTLIFSGFFGRESGPKNKRPLLRFFEHPPCPRPRSVTEKRLRRFNWTRGGCLRKYSGRTTARIPCIANKLDLIRNRASVLNSLSSSGAPSRAVNTVCLFKSNSKNT